MINNRQVNSAYHGTWYIKKDDILIEKKNFRGTILLINTETLE